jgi:2-keto-3-deoxy-6-phosphogluconate aldolase
VLAALVAAVPADVCVGVGTVMDDTVKDLAEIKALGAKFAISPINPTGFIAECHRVGLLPVPAGASPIHCSFACAD